MNEAILRLTLILEIALPLYLVVTSQLVIDEASLGDPDAARRRLEALDGIPVLPANPDVDSVADATELPRIYKLLNELGLSGMLVCAPIEFFGGS